MSNHPSIQQLVAPSGGNLTARLAATTEAEELVEKACWSVLGRAPDPEESAHLVKWVTSRPRDRQDACGSLVWALLTSAEFRFIH